MSRDDDACIPWNERGTVRPRSREGRNPPRGTHPRTTQTNQSRETRLPRRPDSARGPTIKRLHSYSLQPGVSARISRLLIFARVDELVWHLSGSSRRCKNRTVLRTCPWNECVEDAGLQIAETGTRMKSVISGTGRVLSRNFEIGSCRDGADKSSFHGTNRGISGTGRGGTVGGRC